MSVSSGDIKIYGSLYMQETDAGTPQGGDIDPTTLVLFDNAALANSPNGVVSVVSTLNTDSGVNVNVFGRTTGGSIVSGVIPINGTIPSTGVTFFERILKISAVQHSGTISIKDSAGTTITTIPSGVSYIRRPFYNASSAIAGGDSKIYYEKVFIKNTNLSYDLLDVSISEIAGGASSKIAFDLEKFATFSTGYIANTSTNRLTSPSALSLQNIGMWGSEPKTLMQDTNIHASGAIGLWLALTLVAGATGEKSTYGVAISGSTI
jgi:hypothetical protein